MVYSIDMREICAQAFTETIRLANNNDSPITDNELFLTLPNTGIPRDNENILYAYAKAFCNIMKPHLEITDSRMQKVYDLDHNVDLLINPVSQKRIKFEWDRAAAGTAKYIYQLSHRTLEDKNDVWDDVHRCSCKIKMSHKTDWFVVICTLGHELIHYINHYEYGMKLHHSTWSQSHGDNFRRYVLIINDHMRKIGSDFRMVYKVNRWHKHSAVIDTQDWMRDNIQIGDDILWNWGEHVGLARVTRRNAHTVSVRHLTRHAFRIRATIPWEMVLYAYRIECPYDISEVLEKDNRRFLIKWKERGKRLIEIHNEEMKELKEIWGIEH